MENLVKTENSRKRISPSTEMEMRKILLDNFVCGFGCLFVCAILCSITFWQVSQVYADHSTNVDDVFTRIVETTQHPAAAASSASIMFAPKAQFSFKEALSRLSTFLCAVGLEVWSQVVQSCCLCSCSTVLKTSVMKCSMKDLEFLRGGSNRVQFHGSSYSSLWSWLTSQFKPLFERVLSQPSTSIL